MLIKYNGFLPTVFLLLTSRLVLGANKYLGCYEDTLENRVLKGHTVDWFDSLTRSRCINHCLKLGFLYAGLEAGRQCFCGDQKPTTTKVSDENCKKKCTGNNINECGGDLKIGVYEIVANKYLGCYVDTLENRVLKGYTVDWNDSLTKTRCINLCFNMGFVYAGLEAGRQCFCGDQKPANTERLSDERCKTKCTGDDNNECGGDLKIGVYETDNPGSNKYLGCYEDTLENRVLKGFTVDWNDFLTKTRCIYTCYSKGFSYAGLEAGTQCFCGNEKPTSSTISDENCKTKCDADNNNECGGDFKIAVYETDIPVANKYLGCYADTIENRVLKGHTVDWNDSLTKSGCINLCFKMGFLYAGLEAGRQCFCGDQKPPATEILSDELCMYACTGDNTNECGGGWKMSVYKTDIPDEPALGKYIGCFKEKEGGKLLDGYKVDLPKTNSARRCMNICLFLGYAYSGVQHGFECFCAHARPPNNHSTPDGNCNTPCPRDPTQMCGSIWILSVYTTGYEQNFSTKGCELSATRYNGKIACKGKELFVELFDEPISEKTWEYTIKFAEAPDYEFVSYNTDKTTISVNDGTLRIKPALLPDELVKHGKVDFGEKCTEIAGTTECSRQGQLYMILPPVLTARITTRNSFNFRYGIVEIRARFPLGDWIIPELRLEPKNNIYGPGYMSGRIRMAMVRGNRQLLCNGKDMGAKLLESGILVGINDTDVKPISVERYSNEEWSRSFHNYSLIWTPDKISFLIDGQQEKILIPQGIVLHNKMGFTADQRKIWESGSNMAPFDDDFYISVGVSVGGTRDFPDSCTNKPWRNYDLKQMLNFWKARRDWHRTWDNIPMEVDHIIVSAL